jgi:hypothetical protein
MIANYVLVSKASSTYPAGKELLLQLGVGRVRMPTPPVLSSPAALLEDHFERSIEKQNEVNAKSFISTLFQSPHADRGAVACG